MNFSIIFPALIVNLITISNGPDTNKTPNSMTICLSAGCVETAGDVLRHMNEQIDPCVDFYQFACGNYIKTSLISNDKTFSNTFTGLNDMLQEQIKFALEEIVSDEPQPFRMVKTYYRSCRNKSLTEKYGLKIAQDLLRSLNGWPVLDGMTWSEEKFNWLNITYKLRKLGLPINSLIDISVGLDFKQSTNRLIQIDQPTLGLSREYLINGPTDKIVRAYYNYMVDIAVIFGAKSRPQTEQELQQSLEFEIKLAKYSMSQEDRRNITNLYNIKTIEALKRDFKAVPWHNFIANIMPQNVKITGKERVLVGVPQYLEAFHNLIENTEKRVLANYLIWRVVKDIISYLNELVRERELEFRHSINGIQDSPPRWKECIEETTNLVPIIVGAMYIRKYFPVEAKQNAMEMVKYIKDEFITNLKQLDWMDNETRSSALKKANNMVDHIAYPDELLDDKKIASLYRNVKIDEQQFLYSALNISKFSMDYGYERLVVPVNKTDWKEHGFPAQVNAFYHPLENSITFPAGILQGVFFNKDRPRYMNFGAVGSVIGHEITHGFDDTGRQFDQAGNLRNWWQKQTIARFLERTQCIIRQYNNYTVPEIKMKLNGVRTQGENIADNGGIKQAYLAYKQWEIQHGSEPKLPGLKYTPQQLFWISAAQIWCSKHRPEALALQVTIDAHAPAQFRVLGPLSNSQEFAKDFKCPLDTTMNPKHKCSIW